MDSPCRSSWNPVKLFFHPVLHGDKGRILIFLHHRVLSLSPFPQYKVYSRADTDCMYSSQCSPAESLEIPRVLLPSVLYSTVVYCTKFVTVAKQTYYLRHASIKNLNSYININYILFTLFLLFKHHLLQNSFSHKQGQSHAVVTWPVADF